MFISHETLPLCTISPTTTPRAPLNMPSQHPPRLHQTPLLLALRLAQRHHEVLLPRLLPVAGALARRLLLGLADGLRALVLLAQGFALLGEGELFFLGVLAEPGGSFDGLCCDGVVHVAGVVVGVFVGLATAFAVEGGVDGRGGTKLLEFG